MPGTFQEATPLTSPSPLAATAVGVEILEDGCFERLLHFRGPTRGSRRKALIVAPFSGVNPCLLHDMAADLALCTDLHLLEWRDAAKVPARCGAFGLADCVMRVRDAVRDLGGEVDLIGLCQSALPALAATALLAAEPEALRPRSLVLIGGKLDPQINSTRGDRFAIDHSLDWFRAHAISVVGPGRLGRGRAVYSHTAQEWVLCSYVMQHLVTGCDLLAKAIDDDGLDPQGHPFLPGLGALLDVPAELFLDLIATVYHADALPRGEMTCFGRPVDPAAIRATALLTVEGGRDDIAAPGQCQVAHRLCPGIPTARHGHRLFPEAGHFDLFHGRTWHDRVRPAVADFLRECGSETLYQ